MIRRSIARAVMTSFAQLTVFKTYEQRYDAFAQKKFSKDILIPKLGIDTINNGNRTEWSAIRPVIVSITKFSIVIGSPRAYLSRNRRAITWVSNYSCPI